MKVLGEGVDTASCDSVYWADVRGSMPDLVQAVGRALRMRPGEGKTASLVVPVLLGPGESPQSMLTSRAYDGLAKLLEALRAHDARVVEALAEPQAPSRAGSAGGAVGEQAGAAERGCQRRRRGAAEVLHAAGSRGACGVHQPACPQPRARHWRRGMEAAACTSAMHGDLRVPFTYRVPVEDEATVAGAGGWPGSLAGFPLGQWIADARRAYGRGRLDEERVRQLDGLGMVWSHFDVAFEEGLEAARAWAGEHGHLLAPVDATWGGYPVGAWLRNQRAAAKRADDGGAAARGGSPCRLRCRGDHSGAA